MRIKICLFWILFILLFGGEYISAQVVDSIRIDGLKRTNENYLKRFISHAKGKSFDSLLIYEEERRLRTLSSVLDVNAELIAVDSMTVLKYHINERWTLLPVGDFGASNDNLWIGAGIMETNFLGRGIYFYGYLQYKTPFAAHLILRDPYFLGSRFGYEFQYKNSEVLERNNYTFSDKYKLHELSFGGKYELAFEKDIFIGLAKREESNYNTSELIDRKTSFRYFFGVHLQHLDFKHFMIDGWQNRFHISLINPSSDHENSLNVYNEFQFFKLEGKTNIATRLLIGLSTEENTLYQPFIVDSYTNFRGSGYRYLRGNQILSSNIECRYTVFENMRAGIQILAFSDIGWIGYRINENYEEQKGLLFAGPGTRLNIKKIHNAVLSIDFGVSLLTPHNNGWVIGWGQYF